MSSIISKSLKEAKRFLKSDPSHGSTHLDNLFRIVDFLIKKEGLENKVDKEVIYLAIIFHDFGRIDNLTNKNKDDHDKRSAVLAKKFLAENKYSRIDKVVKLIADHDSKPKTDDLEKIIFHDADILDVLGAVGIGRTFTYGGQISRGLDGSIQRLLWKSFRDQPMTKTARKIAVSRRKFIREFIKQYNQELNLKDGK